MFFWFYAEPIIIVLALVFIVTQMLVPAFTNQPAFPFFRRIFTRKRETEKEIRDIDALLDLKELEKEAKTKKRQLRRG